ncbi:methyltransferase domain-containing protein [Arthrobacter sp. ISL-30]|nr:methyltransferase domain-containing protein [Arthrobacter sp. ISL-30]
MDKADCDPVLLDNSYARFPLVNRLVSGWEEIYRRKIRPLLATTGSLTLLDIGCGSGDVARGLSRMASREELRLDITAIDPDERAYQFASKARETAGVVYRQAHSAELVAEGRRFDVVLSNHVLHHLSPSEFSAMLRDCEALCTRLTLHNDLDRSPLAWLLFAAGFWPLGIGSYIWRDGLTSIRRSYTLAELAAVAPPGWTVEPQGPWHNLLLYRGTEGAGEGGRGD